MQPIADIHRRKIVAAAAMTCAIPMVLVPITGRSSFELAAERAVFNDRFRLPAASGPIHFGTIKIVRDPFVSEALPGTSRSGTANIAAGPGEAAVPIIRAIISGSSPRALLEEGGKLRIAGIGDRIGKARIVQIGGSAIQLANGTMLRFDEVNP